MLGGADLVDRHTAQHTAAHAVGDLSSTLESVLASHRRTLGHIVFAPSPREAALY